MLLFKRIPERQRDSGGSDVLASRSEYCWEVGGISEVSLPKTPWSVVSEAARADSFSLSQTLSFPGPWERKVQTDLEMFHESCGWH